MKKESFYAYLNNEKQFDEESLNQLKQITEMHPYFMTAKLMLLKNMKAVEDLDYTSELKKVVITCCDRGKLFYYLNDDRYARFFPKTADKERFVEDRTEVLLDSFLNSFGNNEEKEQPVIDESENELDAESIVSTDYLVYLEQTEQAEDTYSNQKESKPMKHQSLVDRFLEKSSSDEELFSNRNKESETRDRLGQDPDNLLDDDTFLTETLAQVYIKQKKYEQALTIIKRLSLNFPKKSIYFADQIRFLEYLIYNEKNKK